MCKDWNDYLGGSERSMLAIWVGERELSEMSWDGWSGKFRSELGYCGGL